MGSKSNINFVVKEGLCTGCGTCVGLCPVDAVQMVIDRKKGIYIPEIADEKCTECGLCVKVCPGHEVDFKRLNQEIFDKQPEDVLLGNYVNCYTGHATDQNIRYNSSSGGLVTALLIFALEQGMINGALVTRMKRDKPLEPEPFIARTREEIIEASGSKYCPVPANIALKGIIKAKKGEKFAVVGLPCHIHGVRKAEINSNQLKERIILHVGILCGGTSSFIGVKNVLNNMGINSDIREVNFRGMGWPGSFCVKLNNGKIKSMPYNKSWLIWSLFTPSRCRYCLDGMAELSDISCGDAWLPEIIINKDNIGESIIIARNEKSDRLLKETLKEKNLLIINKSDLINSQKGMLYKKKVIGQINTNMRNKLHSNKSNLIDYFMAMFLNTFRIYQIAPFDKLIGGNLSILKLHQLPLVFATKHYFKSKRPDF